MANKLNKYEQETIINFNKEHDKVWIFTYEKKLQRDIESKNIAESVSDNGHGGKEYVIPYSQFRMYFLRKRGRKKAEDGL